jgi:uncharacterized protein (DUF2147 family)
MKHYAFSAAMGLLTAAVFAYGGHAQASAADPTGYWKKPDAERNAKIQITRCGKGGAQLCSSIVWLENPNDKSGRPLHDIRNENPSMRDRPIQGLPLFNGMTRTGPSTWTGKIYNPEDGNTYSATLTMVSNKQIVLKGCKAWLLCGEKMWLRTSPPPQPKPDEEELIEASTEPQTTQPAQAATGAMPATKPETTSPGDLVETANKPDAVPAQPNSTASAVELMTPTTAPDDQAVRPGYGFLSVSTQEPTPEKFSGENVPSMFTMADPIEAEEVSPAVQAQEAAPLPAPKPKATQATAAATHDASPEVPTQPAQGADTPETAQQAALAADQELGQEHVVVEQPMTRRQMRALRRQERQLLPWLR